MRPNIALALLALDAAAVAAQKVVGLDFVKQRKMREPSTPLRRRAGTVTETLYNDLTLYFANVTIGTPGQAISLQIDTGSSDVWVPSSTASVCQGASAAANCEGGTFNAAASSTYNVVASPIFNITYVDNSYAVGRYFTDVIDVGGATITGQQMGLATDTTIGTGIMGVGFALDESLCHVIPCNTYPTIVQQMVTEGQINTMAYSLYLDDLEADTGSILFGGVDTDKYMGDLVVLPVQVDANSLAFTSFTVAWTGFTLTTKQGTRTGFVPSGFVEPAILDSGTSLTIIPDDLASALNSQLSVTYSRQAGGYIAACNLGGLGATMNFQFGGTGGVTIQVPVSEMLIPLTTTNGSPATSNGKAVCLVGYEAAQGRPILLGDTFLRSAYVVYDLTNKQIALAQTNFNATGSNVKEITSGTAGIPGASSTATASVVAAPVTGPVKGATGYATVVSTAVDGAVFTGLAPLAAGSTSVANALHAAPASAALLSALVAGLVGTGALMVLL